MKAVKNIILFFSALSVVACSDSSLFQSPESKKLLPPPKEAEKVKVTKGEVKSANVDILFLIDDSGSMSVHQQNLKSNISDFIDNLGFPSQVSLHAGVLLTSFGDQGYEDYGRAELKTVFGCPRFITDSSVSSLNCLKSMVVPGTNGSGAEMFFDPIVDFFAPDLQAGVNKGFLRSNSQLVLIILSDAEDQSDVDTTGSDAISKLKRGPGLDPLVYAIAAEKSVSNFSGRCETDGATGAGTYAQTINFLKQLNSKNFSLCDPQFSLNLRKISSEISERAANIIYLESIPGEDTIKVTYDGNVVENHPTRGWVYDPQLNAIRFGPQTPFPNFFERQKLLIDYELAQEP